MSAAILTHNAVLIQTPGQFKAVVFCRGSQKSCTVDSIMEKQVTLTRQTEFWLLHAVKSPEKVS